MLVWHGPKGSSHLVVFAPGDAGRLCDTAPTAIAEGLAAAGLRVVRFASPIYAPDEAATQRDARLAAEIQRAATSQAAGQKLVLGGLSRGARVSASLVHQMGAVALLGFAYPFHARRDPNPYMRAVQLGELAVPVLICQGTRDSHGNRQQVLGYRLPAHVHFHWLEDANHALRPRARSGHVQATQLAEAAKLAAAFIRSAS